MVYLRARYYDPSTGQFLSRDPLEQLTQQPYSYANDNPLNGTDPTGLDCGLLDPGGCVNDLAGTDVGGAAVGFVAKNWRPIASAVGDVATTATCIGSAGTACGFAISANLGLQSTLAAIGPGSTGHKLALIGANVLLAGGASVGAAVDGALEEADQAALAAGEAETPSWVGPYIKATSTAPYLGLTTAQLASYPWITC